MDWSLWLGGSFAKHAESVINKVVTNPIRIRPDCAIPPEARGSPFVLLMLSVRYLCNFSPVWGATRQFLDLFDPHDLREDSEGPDRDRWSDRFSGLIDRTLHARVR